MTDALDFEEFPGLSAVKKALKEDKDEMYKLAMDLEDELAKRDAERDAKRDAERDARRDPVIRADGARTEREWTMKVQKAVQEGYLTFDEFVRLTENPDLRSSFTYPPEAPQGTGPAVAP